MLISLSHLFFIIAIIITTTVKSLRLSMSSSPSITLYGSQQTRSPLVNWYLIEKNIPFNQKNPSKTAGYNNNNNNNNNCIKSVINYDDNNNNNKVTHLVRYLS